MFFTEIKQIIIAIEQTRIGANHICTHISNALLGLYVTWSSPVFIYISSHECLSTRFEVTQYRCVIFRHTCDVEIKQQNIQG